MIMARTLTPKELTAAFNEVEGISTTDKEVRKFLRSRSSGLAADAPGKGGRWAIEAKKVRSLRTKFAKWDAARRDAEGKVTTDDPEVEVDEVTAPDAD